MKLNARQQRIIDFAKEHKTFQTKDIFAIVAKEFGVERMTVVRDLSFLVREKILLKTGKGRSVAYNLSGQSSFIKPINVEKYYKVSFRDRNINPVFNDDVFALLDDNIFTTEEIKHLEELNKKYIYIIEDLKKESPAILRKEWERLIVELSWKSSEIEGNTYTLLETEALIKEHQYAKGKARADAQMILNHKSAIDLILKEKDFFIHYTAEKIKKMHSILIDGLDVKNNYRTRPVGISGTLYRPPAKEQYIDKVIEKLVKAIRNTKSPFAKAFIALIMIAYIQPFEDGNKRTSRIVANSILHAHDKAMLSYRDVDAMEYKKAALLFYEINNISYIKKIFIEQFEDAVNNYFN